MDDLDQCMAVPKKLRLPREIDPEGVAMMVRQLNGHTANREQADILVKLVAMQHPKKPYWWQVAKALWEQERGIC
ncbi:hypothetical protein PGN35_000645 [Nodosilinea sp. PGN35]|uniref:hypothetical protein n=1 Tax=Nodosilinea sp. PGN35 TaxID=3020489 RepID=UPI0023B2544E|nr:hypothetical protein [Nodosilinea sp. TSF1-S3]MDF0369079.1 hypothetical protein [Nodosilinea sp. TSF1-S3]